MALRWAGRGGGGGMEITAGGKTSYPPGGADWRAHADGGLAMQPWPQEPGNPSREGTTLLR